MLINPLLQPYIILIYAAEAFFEKKPRFGVKLDFSINDI